MIKIEVTGTTLGEVSDKLLAIGASLQRTVSYEADNAAREALQAQRDAAKSEQPLAEEKPKRRKKAEEPLVDTGNDAGAAVAGSTGEPPAASPPSAQPAEEEPELPMGQPQEQPKELSFDHDVAPKVIAYTVANGRGAIAVLLEQFGVERASQIPAARWPELIELLEG